MLLLCRNETVGSLAREDCHLDVCRHLDDSSLGMSNSRKVLAAYRSLMKEARTLPAYNFRMYALRRIRDAFKDDKTIKEQGVITRRLEFAEESLNLIKRQAQIGQLYSTDKLIIEK